MTSEVRVIMKVNGTEYHVTTQTSRTLAEVLRDDLGLLGTKIGCNKGECGACTVIMNGRSVTSCLVLAVQAEGATITTIEGLAEAASRRRSSRRSSKRELSSVVSAHREWSCPQRRCSP